MNDDLKTTLIDACYAATMACYEANAAEPYVHSVYQAAADRRDRLAAALCDGNDELLERWTWALYDIYHDGEAWARQVFADLEREVAWSRAYDAACKLNGWATIEAMTTPVWVAR